MAAEAVIKNLTLNFGPQLPAARQPSGRPRAPREEAASRKESCTRVVGEPLGTGVSGYPGTRVPGYPGTWAPV